MKLLTRISVSCLLFLAVNLCAPIAGAQATIFFTGKLDGYPIDDKQVPARPTHPSILIGMGDNLSFDYSSRFDQLGNPVPRTSTTSNNAMITFLQRTKYDALVPGAEDFDFGAAFLSRAELPMVASNIVSCPQPDSQGPQASPGQAQVLLPTQASLPSSVSNGGLGGGKGKSGGSSSAPSGGSAAALTGASVGCQKASPHGFAKLAFPTAGSIYPWTTMIVVSIPNGMELVSNSTVLEVKPVQPANGGKAKTLSKPLPDPALVGNTGLNYTTYQGGAKYYLYDLSKLVTVNEDGSLKDAHKITSPDDLFLLWPGSSLTLHLKLKLPNASDGSGFLQDLPLTVQRPFFDYAWRSFPEQCSSTHQPLCDFTVFGVVDPALQAQISQLNLDFNPADESGAAMANTKQSYYAAFNEAASSLVQAALAYEYTHHVDLNAKPRVDPGTTYVVMAQMAPDIAAGLARDIAYRTFTYGRLVHPFDVIFSAADAYSHTPQGSTHWTWENPGRIPVITPRPLLLPKFGELGPRLEIFPC